MKGLAFLFGVLLIAGVGNFAFGVSAGVGGSVEANSSELNAVGTYLGYTSTMNAKGAYTPFGAHAFIDATYAELSVGYQMRMVGSATLSGSGMTTTTSNVNIDYSYLAFQGLGKYPFKVGKITLFPLLGAAYALNLTVSDSISGADLKTSLSTQDKADLNEFWLKGGFGADFPIGKLFFRTEGLIGFRLLNQSEKDLISNMQNSILSAGYSSANVTMRNMTFGLALMIGYTF